MTLEALLGSLDLGGNIPVDVLLGVLVLHERLNKAQWASVLLAAAGVQPVALLTSAHQTRPHPDHPAAGSPVFLTAPPISRLRAASLVIFVFCFCFSTRRLFARQATPSRCATLESTYANWLRTLRRRNRLQCFHYQNEYRRTFI